MVYITTCCGLFILSVCSFFSGTTISYFSRTISFISGLFSQSRTISYFSRLVYRMQPNFLSWWPTHKRVKKGNFTSSPHHPKKNSAQKYIYSSLCPLWAPKRSETRPPAPDIGRPRGLEITAISQTDLGGSIPAWVQSQGRRLAKNKRLGGGSVFFKTSGVGAIHSETTLRRSKIDS